MLVKPEPDEPVELHPSIPVYWICPVCNNSQIDSYRDDLVIRCLNCDDTWTWDDVIKPIRREMLDNAIKEMYHD